LDTIEGSHSEQKYWYVAGLLSAIFLVEVIFSCVRVVVYFEKSGQTIKKSMASCG
jgi:hypothetical protein